MTRVYVLNLKTGKIFSVIRLSDGAIIGYDWSYVYKNRQDLKSGFKSMEEAKEYYKCQKNKKKKTTRKKRQLKG